MSAALQRDALALATDDLNAAIDEASAALKALNLAASAQLLLDAPNTWLGFGKVGQEWMLYVREKDGDPKPLRSASRGRRVAACAVLDVLLDLLIVASETQLGEVQIAIAQAEDFAARVRKQSARQ